MNNRAIDFSIVGCSLGRLVVAATDRGVCHIRFGDHDAELEQRLRGELPYAPVRRHPTALKPWSDELVSYVDGHSTRLDLPLDVSGSRLQRRVWEALRAIPRGQTRSYSEVAASLGMPRGARAVGRACATNPVPVAIPRHRVVAKDGGLTGYAYGVARKRALLEREARDPAWPASGIPPGVL